jgi:DNA-directed RNA polymerase subunit RPC12/RpoP
MRFLDYLIDETVTSTDIAVLDKKISMEKRKDVCPECGYKLTYKI